MDSLRITEHNTFPGQHATPHRAISAGRSVATNAVSANAATADSPSVTANDFLTLLVTELKNQDPTANTDPNAYVNQLVQVNSLQQLIQINGDLQTPPAATQSNSQPNSAHS